MHLKLVSIFLKFFSLGFVIGSGGLWTSAGVDTKPKCKEQQTLIGGAIWSQIVIPIGLILSLIAKEDLFSFVHAYFLFAGTVLLIATSLVLIIHEGIPIYRAWRSSTGQTSTARRNLKWDKLYFTIGMLMFVASISTFADFILVITWSDRK